MFARDSFTPTYSGPITATGEMRRRAVSDAGANRAFSSERRAFRPMNQGVSAGSKAMAYRQSLASETNAASAATPESAYLQAIADDMQARATYDQNAAAERTTLRDLLLDSDSVARNRDLMRQEDTNFSELKRRERAATNRMAAYQRQSGLFGGLAGLFS